MHISSIMEFAIVRFRIATGVKMKISLNTIFEKAFHFKLAVMVTLHWYPYLLMGVMKRTRPNVINGHVIIFILVVMVHGIVRKVRTKWIAILRR
jgi:hypothetical protein